MQKGYSALGIFLMGLVMLYMMNRFGFFTVPKSPTRDTGVYTVTESNQLDGKSLLITDIKLKKATPTPKPSPGPTSPPIPTPTTGPIPTVPTPKATGTATPTPPPPPPPPTVTPTPTLGYY